MSAQLRIALLLVPAFLLVACGGDGEEGGATATPTGETLMGVELLPLAAGAEAEVPDGVALIIEIGCTECDGPTEGLARVYKDASGELHVDTLFEEPAGPPDDLITSFALSADGASIVVGVCPNANCPFLAFGEPDAETVLYRSDDGGVTWREIEKPDGVYDVRAVLGDNVILQGPLDDEGLLQDRFYGYPGGAELTSPEPESALFMVGGGEIGWLTADGRLLRTSGGEFVSLDAGFHVAWASGGRFWFDASGGRIPLVVYDEETGHYLGLFGGGGGPQRFYRLDGGASIGGWLDEDRTIGNAVVPVQGLTGVPDDFPEALDLVTLPAIFDFAAHEVRPIPQPFLERYGRNRVVAVVPGPFARVVGAGDCLNVREEPAAGAAVVGCFADGVLLRDEGEERRADGQTWVHVRTPRGREGWASLQYLAR